MPGENYLGEGYLGEGYAGGSSTPVASGTAPVFPPTPPNRSYSYVQNPLPPFQTLQYQIESPLYIYKQRENWAEIDQQRFHDETLQWYGEECVVRLLWRAEDAAAGLVTYCQTCQVTPDPTHPDVNIKARASAVYRQSGNSYCPDCYGTTFTGGFQPIAYHLYMLAADTPDVRRTMQVGQFWQQNPSVQFSWFPQIRQGDLVFRVDSWNEGVPVSVSQRFQVNNVNPITIRTGPGPSAQYPYRTGKGQPLQNTTKIVNQTCTLEALPPDSPYYSVAFV